MEVKGIGSIAIMLYDQDYAEYKLDMSIVEQDGLYFGAWNDPKAGRRKATEHDYKTVGAALNAAIRGIEL